MRGSSVTDTKDMIETVPGGVPLGAEPVAAAIDACLRCVQSCTTCANADLVEDDVAEMRTCIARCLNCADVCEATARLLSRPADSEPAVVQLLLQACVRTCASCADECARHAQHHRHCAICENVCRACVEACTALLDGEF
jgi:hypothetical protein